MACLLITHDLALARQFAERVIVMHAGQIVEEGRTEAILARRGTPTQRPCCARPRPRPRAWPTSRASAAAFRIRATRCLPAASPCAATRADATLPTCERPRLTVEGAAHIASPAGDRSVTLLACKSQQALSGRWGRLLHAVTMSAFAIEAGSSLGLVGESGSGKSTIARLVDASDRAGCRDH